MNLENHQIKSEYRFERKFQIRKNQLDKFQLELLNNGFSEIFYERRINNLYLDNYTFEDVIDNVEGFSGRRKTRIRWYGPILGPSKKVLEQKIKSDDVNKKKSLELGKLTLEAFDATMKLYLQIENIIDQNQYSDLLLSKRPTLLNSYRRNYYMNINQNVRITLDQDLFYYSPIYNTEYKDRNIVIEIKSDSDRIMQQNMFRDLNLSKYSKYVKGVLATSSFHPIY